MALNMKRPDDAQGRARKNATPVQEIPEPTVAREPVREQVRAPSRVEAIGRDGVVLRRKHTGGENHDKFHVPDELKEIGWDYEWKEHDVLGKIDHHALNNYASNGFTPVTAKHLVERYMPPGHTGSIIVDGLILMERPTVLGDEARREERIKAQNQMRDQRRHLSLKSQLPPGFEQDDRYAGTSPTVNRVLGPAHDAPRPQYQIADAD